MKNCRMIIRRCFFSQELSLISPSTVIVAPVQKQQFLLELVYNISHLANQAEQLLLY